jgi:hypothetical protein
LAFAAAALPFTSLAWAVKPASAKPVVSSNRGRILLFFIEISLNEFDLIRVDKL